ncbi:hypothetical protein QR680_011561 [Steinernema hermaphroditum]|uniref:Uncharacterized protein n=1 Tax=Steinernema hermaphroditum TaxID=289476 RepID=A0AA39I165_9BILA|nr:hypothetical protein QR680_011561 [Steinernema hermaphroditum]
MPVESISLSNGIIRNNSSCGACFTTKRNMKTTYMLLWSSVEVSRIRDSGMANPSSYCLQYSACTAVAALLAQVVCDSCPPMKKRAKKSAIGERHWPPMKERVKKSAIGERHWPPMKERVKKSAIGERDWPPMKEKERSTQDTATAQKGVERCTSVLAA